MNKNTILILAFFSTLAIAFIISPQELYEENDGNKVLMNHDGITGKQIYDSMINDDVEIRKIHQEPLLEYLNKNPNKQKAFFEAKGINLKGTGITFTGYSAPYQEGFDKVNEEEFTFKLRDWEEEIAFSPGIPNEDAFSDKETNTRLHYKNIELIADNVKEITLTDEEIKISVYIEGKIKLQGSDRTISYSKGVSLKKDGSMKFEGTTEFIENRKYFSGKSTPSDFLYIDVTKGYNGPSKPFSYIDGKKETPNGYDSSIKHYYEDIVIKNNDGMAIIEDGSAKKEKRQVFEIGTKKGDVTRIRILPEKSYYIPPKFVIQGRGLVEIEGGTGKSLMWIENGNVITNNDPRYEIEVPSEKKGTLKVIPEQKSSRVEFNKDEVGKTFSERTIPKVTKDTDLFEIPLIEKR